MIEHWRPGTLDELIIHEVFDSDVYKLDALREFIDGGVVLDVGANIGCVTVRCLELGARHVIAVEPEAENRALWFHNVAPYEPMGHRVTMLACAVGDPLDVPRVDIVGTSGDAYAVPGDAVSVADFGTVLTRGLEQSRDGRIALLKVDVEGGEYSWFDTATGAMLQRINRIHMEWHGDKRKQESDYGVLLTKLAWTHSVSVFGRPDTGGMLYAHPYE